MESEQGNAVEVLKKLVSEKQSRPDVSSLWSSMADQFDGMDKFAKHLMECYEACVPGSAQQVSIMRMFVELHQRAADAAPDGLIGEGETADDLKAVITELMRDDGSKTG